MPTYHDQSRETALSWLTTISLVSIKTVTSRREIAMPGPLVDLNFGFGGDGALYWASLRFSAVKSALKGDRPLDGLQDGKSPATIVGKLWIQS